MKTKLFAGTLLATMMTLGMSQAVVAGPPAHAGGGGGNGSDESCDLTVNHSHACADAVSNDLGELDLAIAGAVSLTNDNVVAKLRVKVCSADLKLEASKPGDAIWKLDEDLRGTIEALRDAPKEKISDADAAAILKEIDDSILCIQSNTF